MLVVRPPYRCLSRVFPELAPVPLAAAFRENDEGFVAVLAFRRALRFRLDAVDQVRDLLRQSGDDLDWSAVRIAERTGMLGYVYELTVPHAA